MTWALCTPPGDSGHGKGAPDSIGAVFKRQADALVYTSQSDKMNATDLKENLEKQEKSVNFS